MKFTEKTQKLAYLLKLIDNGYEGNADALSNIICVAPRTLSRFIEELRTQGHKIGYCAVRKRYYIYDKK
jgi:hypothetical protein